MFPFSGGATDFFERATLRCSSKRAERGICAAAMNFIVLSHSTDAPGIDLWTLLLLKANGAGSLTVGPKYAEKASTQNSSLRFSRLLRFKSPSQDFGYNQTVPFERTPLPGLTAIELSRFPADLCRSHIDIECLASPFPRHLQAGSVSSWDRPCLS